MDNLGDLRLFVEAAALGSLSACSWCCPNGAALTRPCTRCSSDASSWPPPVRALLDFLAERFAESASQYAAYLDGSRMTRD